MKCARQLLFWCLENTAVWFFYAVLYE